MKFYTVNNNFFLYFNEIHSYYLVAKVGYSNHYPIDFLLTCVNHFLYFNETHSYYPLAKAGYINHYPIDFLLTCADHKYQKLIPRLNFDHLYFYFLKYLLNYLSTH
jgi:hypothetical protein